MQNEGGSAGGLGIKKRCIILAGVIGLLLLQCSHDVNKFADFNTQFKVSYNPYQSVDWTSWKRCLSQHHDHVKTSEKRIRDYDAAGYQAVALLDYAGVKSKTYTHRERIWPFTKFFPQYQSDAAFMATAQNLKFFIPSMEEVGVHHMTSPFMTKYVELFEKSIDHVEQSWQYRNEQELIDEIDRNNGFPIIAHPTRKYRFYERLNHFNAIEIYNAFYNFNHRNGKISKDMNAHFVTVWDNLLAYKSNRIFGFAVNDWYGPFNKDVRESDPDIYDSGKTLVLLPEYTLDSYRKSVEMGAFFALKDLGVKKGGLPKVERIEVDGEGIHIESDGGKIRWIFCGDVIAEGADFPLTALPHNFNYIRAEIQNENGTVYVQPFSLTPIPAGNE